MDAIDLNLFDAWCRVRAKLADDPHEALKRWRRTRTSSLTRPPRAWCLVLRASDTRINSYNSAITLDPDVELGLDESVEHALSRGVAHDVVLQGDTIRALCKPIMIPWPGVHYRRAADMLGLTSRMMLDWIRKDRVEVRYEPPRPHGQRGNDVPVVWTKSPLDPNGLVGAGPDGIWGTLWQGNHEKLPGQYTITVRREARFRTVCGRVQVMGWDWICPGRLNAEGDYEGCGRRCRKLYGPLPIWTIGQALGEEEGIEIGSHKTQGLQSPGFGGSTFLGLTGTWHPGQHDPLAGQRSFACGECWAVKNLTLTNRDGWNEFITHVSGGLLYGHEVQRPGDEVPMLRKRKFISRPKAAPRRAEALGLLLVGLTDKQIGRRMGIGWGSVRNHIDRLFREYGVHSRKELKAKVDSGQLTVDIGQKAG